MYRIIVLFLLVLCLTSLPGCSSDSLDTGVLMQQLETFAGQIDVEAIVTDVIERIDWEELKGYARQGYDALTDRFPALKAENVKSFLKENGLSLLKKYVESSDETMQDNARKLGEILKILNPELTEEVDQVIG